MNTAATVGAMTLLLMSASICTAQTFNDLRIEVAGKTITTSKGEEDNVTMQARPVTIGKVTHAYLSKLPDMCGFGVTGRAYPEPGAISAWSVDVTPLKVADDAVTFRLQWIRAIDEGRQSSGPSGDVELTLRPGQSLPIDVIPLSASATMPYNVCHVRATSLRVLVDYSPPSQDDRRLVSTDLWLIEKLPDGTERSQTVTLRGQPHRESPFYFDTVTDGATSLDFFGYVAAAPGDGDIDVKLETRARLIQNGQATLSIRAQGNMFTSRQVTSSMRLKSDAVAAVELPRLSDNDNGAFANHTFSIRVRSRQIR